MVENTLFTPEQQLRVEELNKILGQMQQLDAGSTLPESVDVKQLADDVMQHHAPEAEQLGVSSLQYQMLNLAVKLGYPDDYTKIKRLLMESEAMCENVFQTFKLPICAMLDDLGLEYEFEYRMKSVYSIWRKMRNDNKEFDDVYDLFATRIIYKVPEQIPGHLAAPNSLDSIPEVMEAQKDVVSSMNVENFYCWRIYNVLSMLYRIHPDRIKNWITKPKPSGYQALQMTVMGPDCNWIEIQIRSERMNYEAEYGVAAHWKYKAEKAVK